MRGANSSAAWGSENLATASMRASTVWASATTSTSRPARRASLAVRGPIAAIRVVAGMCGELLVHLLGDRAAGHEDRVDAPGSDVLGDALGHRHPDGAVGDDAADPVPGIGEHAGEHRLRDLAAEGEDVAGLRLEADQLLGHAGRGVVALGHQVDAVADGEERCRGRLTDGGHLRGRRDDGPIGVEHVDGRGARDGEPVELAGRQVGERLLERRPGRWWARS